jgi:hypothetical protein
VLAELVEEGGQVSPALVAREELCQISPVLLQHGGRLAKRGQAR